MAKKKESNPGPPDINKKPAAPPPPPPNEIGFRPLKYTKKKKNGNEIVEYKKIKIFETSYNPVAD